MPDINTLIESNLLAEDNKDGDCKPKGKILRIKHGYNPNSSSMGSIVFALPVALLGITVGFGLVSSLIMSAFVKSTNNQDLETGKIETNKKSPPNPDKPEKL